MPAGCRRVDAQTQTPTAARPVTATWTYEATVRDGAAGIDVRVCFADVVPASLGTIADTSPDAFSGIEVQGGSRLAFDGDQLALTGVLPGGCIRYGVDLRGDDTDGSVSWVGDSVLVRQSQWLLWPEDVGRDATADLTLRLPDGVRASVPWPLLAGSRDGASATYRLDSTISRWLGYTALGTLAIDRFDRAGAEIELVRLDAPLASDAAGLRRWIVDAVDGAAMLYGNYPRRRLQVLVLPVEGGRGTIYFGMAARGGGSGVYLLVDAQAPAQRLPGGWTTVHELLHHGMPFVRDAWMSEGFVSYYTEIVRTRQGHRDEATGWLELWDAFDRGARSGAGLSLGDASDRMHETHAYQRVYWGGAAIAFDLDVQLRLETKGRLGLDDAMKELRRCCGDAVVQYSADALLELLDAWYGRPLFSETARRHLGPSDFPDVAATFGKLGVTRTAGGVEIDREHGAAASRAAIMAPRARP